jgi:hypothetical protein
MRRSRPRPDVEAGHDDGAVGTRQLPAEPDLVVVDVDAAHAAEAVAGELGLHPGHHLAEGGVPLRLQHRVDVAAVARPGPRDVLGPPRRIGLVPHRQVRVHRARHVGHVAPPVAHGDGDGDTLQLPGG